MEQKTKNRMFLISACVVAVTAGLFAGWNIPEFQMPSTNAENAGAFWGGGDEELDEGPKFVGLGQLAKDGTMAADTIIVNLRDPQKVVSLVVRISLQTRRKHFKTVKKEVLARRPMLKNELTAYLADKTSDDVRGAAFINKMRREIRDIFNLLLFDDGVERIDAVHFEEFYVRE